LRTDVRWARIERDGGTFDFSAERSAFALARTGGFRILGILAYGHPIHTQNRAPSTAAEREGFARFAEAAERELGNLVDGWEVWNEPNHPLFWPPAPDARAFVALFERAAEAIWQVRPQRQLVAGGLSEVDQAYLDQIRRPVAAFLRRGPVALSLHPYRKSNPETLFGDLSKAGLIDATGRAVTPEGVPIWITEWGYCRLWPAVGPTLQGEMDVRIPMVTAALGVPLTILFELVDGGPQTKSQYTCGLLEAGSLRPHPAAQLWEQGAWLFRQVSVERPGVVQVNGHWSVAAVGGSVSWGEGPAVAGLCSDSLGPNGSAVPGLRVGNTVICYTRQS